MNHRLIPIRSRFEWKQTLSRVPHSFGHTWENCYALQLSSGLDTYLYHFENVDNHIICPLSERTYRGYTDIFTPYGFSGFVGNKEYPNFDQQWKDFVKSQNYICGYIGLNPILERKNFFKKENIYSNNTLYAIDLTLSLEQLYKNLSTNRRRQVINHENIIHTFTQDKSILKNFFLKNYYSFFSKRNATQLLKFTDETLSSFINSDNVLMIGKLKDEKVEAVSLFGYSPHIAVYLFNLSIPEGKHHTVPLLWQSIKVLKELGIPTLNFGGGVKKDDSLAEFKKRFGGKEFPLATLKQVYDKEVYLNLCKHANVTADLNGFFPPYHNPKILGKKS